MTYAFLTDGLDHEGKEKFDAALEQSGTDTASKARRERQAVAQAIKWMK